MANDTPIRQDRLREAVPRYTSYPTAPHFHAAIGARQARRWIADIGEKEPLSLYIHVPFCDRLCWFCACHTKQTLRYEPVAAFLDSLHEEVGLVASLLAGRGRLQALHFGGGSPTLIRPADLRALMAKLSGSFNPSSDVEISVEIDPNDMDSEKLDALAEIGLTRASLGIQDFDPKVQRAINREQSFELTSSVVHGLRERGVRSVNLDLLYGLPHQTCESVAETVRRALSLEPDRIALFGYAHVPWFKRHQSMIEETALPGPAERLAQSLRAAEIIAAAGLVPIGLDHFARPGDSLATAAANGTMHRNFQGYTDDGCETLIGLGPSSISRYRQGFTQNFTAMGHYARAIRRHDLPVARGIELSLEDRARAWVIERLMCDFNFSAVELIELFGETGRMLLREAVQVAAEPGSILFLDAGRFGIAAESRPLVRTVAARFDTYLQSGLARHSAAV
jgi:oxygen-independent coproporphyrinogen III oxidase